jgi:hypothetical protein
MTPVRRRYLSWILIGLPVLMLIGTLIVVMQAKAFLRSDRFRTFLGGKVSQSIHAKGVFQPLEWSGSSFYTDGFTAAGEPGSTWEAIGAEQLRASVNLQGLWSRKWQVESVEVERLTLMPAAKKERAIDDLPVRVKRPRPPADPDDAPMVKATPSGSPNIAPSTPGFFASLLPNQVDVQRVAVADFSLDGKNLKTPFMLESVKVEAKPDGKAWMLQASGGSLSLLNKPKINISDLAVRYVDQTLFVSRGSFAVAGGGTATVTGQLSEKVEKSTDLQVKLDKMPAATILPEDWRARLQGMISADLHVVGDGQEWVVSGPVSLIAGRLEALPVLDQVALFTRTQRFRQLNLEKVTADVVVQEGKISVSKLNAESPGLVRVTGDFIIQDGQMAGDFMVGVTPGSLRWIPGSQTKIFTVEREGYLWTTMKVTGPLDRLREDLSERLAVAAGQDLIDTIQKDPSKLQDTLQDAAESLLDLFGK